MRIARHRTALSRRNISRPVQLAIEDGFIYEGSSVFDYGCGRGDDVRNLNERGIKCSGWDPNYSPERTLVAADVVNLGYVINVIEESTERAAALKGAWSLTKKVLVVSARLTTDAKDGSSQTYGDGYLTRLSTFQKYYEQYELRAWINDTIGVESVPAAPGIFYVFRDDNLKQAFAASRYRRVSSAPRLGRSNAFYERYKAILEPLIGFVASRGRLPDETEIEEAQRIVQEIGSLKRAFSIICRVTGAEQWHKIREERAQDLLIYIALSKFSRRPRFIQLPKDLQLDIRAFFSTYRRACDLADELLFSAGNTEMVDAACRAASAGKQTPRALYVHVSALHTLPPILRVYEGCARSYIGAVEGVNIIKLHRGVPQVSYLSYPDFDKDPHPALAASLVIPLQTFRVQFRDYRDSNNPFILHRKEEFVAAEYPHREKFARLTRREEMCGLFESPEQIGTRDGWEKVLETRGVRLAGHRLVKGRRYET